MKTRTKTRTEKKKETYITGEECGQEMIIVVECFVEKERRVIDLKERDIRSFKTKNKSGMLNKGKRALLLST